MTGRAAARDLLLLAALPLLLGIDLFHSRDKAVEEGNAQMKAGKPEQALGLYDEAVKRLPQDPGAHFNRGAALYGLKRWDEAAQSFLEATEAKAPELKASAFYNLGNAFFQSKKFGEAVEAFKKSLAYNPGDQRAKYNLELALRYKKDEDRKKDKDGKNKPDDQNKQEDPKGEQKPGDEQDEQAKNEPEKPGDQPKGDKDGKDKADQKDPKGEQDKPDQKPEQAKNDPQQKPQDQQAQQKPQKDGGQGKPQQDKQDQKQASNQPQPGSAGKSNKPPPDMQEVEAILDNLEKSPKALEQELARIRAMHRRPPAKDW